MDVFSLQWLVGDKISSVKYFERSKSWRIGFESGSSANLACMWRLLEGGIISATSEEHGCRFGNEDPFDGIAALKAMGRYKIDTVNTKTGTGDLIIKFNQTFMFEILVTSAGYEEWSITHPTLGTVFSRGGELHAY